MAPPSASLSQVASRAPQMVLPFSSIPIQVQARQRSLAVLLQDRRHFQPESNGVERQWKSTIQNEGHIG